MDLLTTNGMNAAKAVLRKRFALRTSGGGSAADGSVERTPLPDALLEAVAHENPLRAATLEWRAQELTRRRRAVDTLSDEMRAAQERETASARERNGEIEGRLAALAEKKQAVLEPLRRAVEEAEREILRRDEEAAIAFAAAGGRYNHLTPGLSELPRPAEPTLEEIAGRLGSGWEAQVKEELPAAMSWGVTAGVGAMIGISVGLMARLMPEPSELLREPLTLPCALLGIGVSIATGQLAKACWAEVAERRYGGHPWLRSAVVAAVVSGLPLLLDAPVETAGLLSGLRATEMFQMGAGGSGASAGAGGVSTWMAFAGSLLLTYPYIVWRSLMGYARAKAATVRNTLTAIQKAEERRTAADFAQNQNHHRAEAARGRAEIARVAWEQAQARYTRHEALFEAERATLTAQIAPIPAPVPARLQQQFEAAQGRIGAMEAIIERSICDLEVSLDNTPPNGLIPRLFWLLGGRKLFRLPASMELVRGRAK
jgi:hypothetical protein